MNIVHAQLDKENINPTLGESTIEFADCEYRLLTLSKDLDVTLTDEQLIQIHDLIGKTIYGESYSDLQDKLLSKESDLDTANDLIDMMQDNLAM